MIYKNLRKVLFMLPPETAHALVMSLKSSPLPVKDILGKFFNTSGDTRLETECAGLRFKHPVGLAAGFDKDAEAVEFLSCFGFSFIETGTVTINPQTGNPKPRVFRLPDYHAIINRMGFPSKGANTFIRNLKKTNRNNIPIGVNIGKNRLTPEENAKNEYARLVEKLFPVADYFCINVSSPNTPGLRDLLSPDKIRPILNACFDMNEKCSSGLNTKPKPIFLKISPDMSDGQIISLIDAVDLRRLSGWVAVNTTLERGGIKETITGGLSGQPLFEKTLHCTKLLYSRTGKTHPIIAVGGVFTGSDVYKLICAGASLVQIYTSWIYEGPWHIKRLTNEIINILDKNGHNNLRDCRGSTTVTT